MMVKQMFVLPSAEKSLLCVMEQPCGVAGHHLELQHMWKKLLVFQSSPDCLFEKKTSLYHL